MTTYQDIAANVRLSPQQRLCWQGNLPAPTLVLDILGEFNPAQWQQRLNTLMAEHEPLRTGLHYQQGLQVPLLAIEPAGEVALKKIENQGAFQDLQAHLAQHELSPLKEQEGQQETGMQAYFVRLNEEHHQVYLSLPPLSADKGTLLRLAQALSDHSSDIKADNAENDSTPYSHYSAWLYELQEDEDAEEGHQYWSKQCPDKWQPQGLVYQQSTGLENQLSEISLTVNSDIEQMLSVFGQQHNTNTETVLLTAWASLLQRLSRDLDQDNHAIPLGWVHDCRQDYEELADSWGLFSKTLPLPWQSNTEENFLSALTRMQGYQEVACEWQEYYAIETDANPFHTRFGFESIELSSSTMATASTTGQNQISIAHLSAHNQHFDMLLAPLRDDNGKLRLCLHYDSNLYVEQSAKVVLEQYLSLLQAALTDATKTLASLSLSSETFSQTLKGLEQTKPWPVLGNQDLYPSLFSQAAQTYRQYTALVTDGAKASLPYNELDNRSNQLAHYLIAQGVKAESRIALHLDTSLDMVIAILAVLKSGAAFVPLDVHQPAARTLDIIQDAAPEFIIDSQQHGAPSLIEIPTLTLDSTTINNALADSALTNRALSDYPTDAPDVTIDADQAAYILFTSGSTGKPKGVVVAHRQLQNYVSSILTRVPLQAGEKSAIVTSLAADLSYTLLFTTLLTGGELHLIERETTLDAQEWARYKTEHAIDNLKVVPSLLDAWLSHGNIAGVLPNKQLILGGEACKPGLLDILSHQSSELQIYNHYGPTEATIGIMMHKAKMPFLAQGLPLSDPLDNTQIYLLDKDLKPVDVGTVAELYIAGASLSRGYLCEKQTAERFLPNPFSGSTFSDNSFSNPCPDSTFSNKSNRLYPSGDLARYLPNGSIELLGRADRQVKIRGYRIELDEIENLLSSLTSVSQAAVVAIPRQQGELQMFAFVSLHPEQKGGIAQLQGQLQDRLPDHMIPTLRLLDHLPLMSNGKLNRQSLSQQAAHLLKQSGSIPPRTNLEKTLADLWSDALGLESVGIDDDFFAFGGHSLAAIKLTSRLQSTLGMPVKVNMIFSAPTVAQFALLVEGIKEKEDTRQVEEGAIQKSLIRLSNEQEKGLGQQEKHLDQASQDVNQQSRHKPQLFCFHPSTGHLQDYRHLPELFPQWQLWGLQANDLNDQTETASDTLTTLAENYLIELRQQQPQGPYHLLGWSLGGLLAITVAGLLEAVGEDVAFLGVVDSQATPDDTAQDIGQFLLWAEEEFDQDSRQRLRHLSSVQGNSLISLLDPAEPKEWPVLLLNWARQQGLQLDNDNWQHAEARQHRHAYTQQLISSFKPTPLKCLLTAWWAEDTLSAQLKTEHSALPINWQIVTSSSALIRSIPSHHFDILQQKDWLQQLQDALDQTASFEPKAPIDPSYDLSYS